MAEQSAEARFEEWLDGRSSRPHPMQRAWLYAKLRGENPPLDWPRQAGKTWAAKTWEAYVQHLRGA